MHQPQETEVSLLVFENMAANILTLLLIRGGSVSLFFEPGWGEGLVNTLIKRDNF